MKRSSSLLQQPQKRGFPTSPQSAVMGEEIIHYSHTKHPLKEITLTELFVCTGCKEYGAGKRFACQQCDFQLHHFCAVSPPVLKDYPLHGQHYLVFHSKPKSATGGISWPRCDVCGKTMRGFTFRCKACSFQMHPCCAMLSTEINFPSHSHRLKLLPAITSSTAPCGACNKRRSGRMYRCTVCEYHLHAVCAKSTINGLQGNEVPPEKTSTLGTVARLASQVVIEFIGGLVEGIGEGVGEAIVQNIARGRCTNRRRIQE